MLTENQDIAVRLSLLEASVALLIEQGEARSKQLEELLALKHKGMGAFSLVALIGGSGLIAGFMAMVKWVSEVFR